MNWKNLIAELMAADQTQDDIADYCDCSQAQISDIHRGRIKEPRHALGEKLKQLHAAVVKAAA